MRHAILVSRPDRPKSLCHKGLGLPPNAKNQTPNLISELAVPGRIYIQGAFPMRQRFVKQNALNTNDHMQSGELWFCENEKRTAFKLKVGALRRASSGFWGRGSRLDVGKPLLQPRWCRCYRRARTMRRGGALWQSNIYWGRWTFLYDMQLLSQGNETSSYAYNHCPNVSDHLGMGHG